MPSHRTATPSHRTAVLYRTAVGSCAALVGLLLAAAFLYGGGDSFHVIGTEVTPTVDVAGLPDAERPAGTAELADLDRLAGTALLLLLLSSVTVLATVLGVIAAENLSLQGRRVIEVMLGAPPALLVGAAARLWARRVGVAAVLGTVLCVAAVAFMAFGAPPGTLLARPAAWPFPAVMLLVASLVLGIATLPVATLYRRGRALAQEAENQHNTDPRPRQFGRVVLITMQLCIAVAILSGSGLLVAAGGARPGTGAPDGAREGAAGSVVGLLSPVGDSARDPLRRAALFESALAALRDAPGLAAESLGTPGAWIGRGPEAMALNECGACSVGGMPLPVHSTRVKRHAVMPGFFVERGLSLVAGRGFSADAAAGEVVINEAYARAHFRDPPVLGRGVQIGGLGEPWYEVVGVVRDGYRRGLGASGSRYAVYYSAVRHPPEQIELVAGVVGAPGAGEAVAPDAGVPVSPDVGVTVSPDAGVEDSLEIVRAALAELPVPELVVAGFKPARDELDRVYGTAGWLGGGARVAGVVAAVVALAGMVGALRAHVRSRWREMGIRSALGADPQALRRMVLREAFRIGAVGVGTGLWLTTLITGVVGPPGVAIFSAPLFLAIAAVFVSAAVVAAMPGARAAASSEPREIMEG